MDFVCVVGGSAVFSRLVFELAKKLDKLWEWWNGPDEEEEDEAED